MTNQETADEITAEIQAQVRHFRPGVYAWLAVLLSAITLPVLALVVSLHLNNNSLEAERVARTQAQVEVQRERETNRKITCSLIIAQDEANNDPGLPPPLTTRSSQAAAAWHDMRKSFHCDGE